MSLSTWLHNSKVSFSVVSHNDKEYLVCKRDVGSHYIHFVEDLQTGNRAFNSNEVSSDNTDDVVRQLINNL